MAAVETCSATVYPTGRWGSFHPQACSKPVTVHREGKPWCTIHDPVRQEAKQAREDQRSRLLYTLNQAAERVSIAERIVLAAVRNDRGHGVPSQRERMIDADVFLAAATKALEKFDSQGVTATAIQPNQGDTPPNQGDTGHEQTKDA